jgi:hypothetical protein
LRRDGIRRDPLIRRLRALHAENPGVPCLDLFAHLLDRRWLHQLPERAEGDVRFWPIALFAAVRKFFQSKREGSVYTSERPHRHGDFALSRIRPFALAIG